MHYFGVNYCQRRWFRSFSDYAFWVTRRSQRTCFSDINIRFFVRILGIELTVLYWVPKNERKYKCMDYSNGAHIVDPLCCLNADIWGDCDIHSAPGVLRKPGDGKYRYIFPIPVSNEVIDSAIEGIKNGGTIHIAGGKGPHLLRDRKGNTAYCGGPGICEFCEEGVPPSGDHHAELVESIVLEHYSEPINVEMENE